MPRSRKPDALSNADRHRRYVAAHDLASAKLPRTLLDRLDKVASHVGGTRAHAVAAALDAWERQQQQRDREVPIGRRAAPANAKRNRPRTDINGRVAANGDLFEALDPEI